MAASGAVRAARSAGARLAASVTITPTATAVTTVLPLTTSDEAGMVSPMALMSASRPEARPSPTTMPPTEASRPTASDSTATDRRT